LLVQKGTPQDIVAAEEQGGDERNRHHLGIGEVALLLISMTQGNKQIGTQAIDGYK
jgi:hypothetical protein